MQQLQPHPPFSISQNQKRLPIWAHYVIAISITISIAFLLRATTIQAYYVEGSSMAPTLQDGDQLMVSKLAHTIAAAKSEDYQPKRGDIVVINGEASPTTADRAPEIIKRVVAIPGDRILINNGRLEVNGVDPTIGKNLGPTYSMSQIKLTVPKGKVYVLGDNRAEGGSTDSRTFGLIDSDLIDGKLLLRVYPFDKIGVF